MDLGWLEIAGWLERCGMADLRDDPCGACRWGEVYGFRGCCERLMMDGARSIRELERMKGRW